MDSLHAQLYFLFLLPQPTKPLLRGRLCYFLFAFSLKGFSKGLFSFLRGSLHLKWYNSINLWHKRDFRGSYKLRMQSRQPWNIGLNECEGEYAEKVPWWNESWHWFNAPTFMVGACPRRVWVWATPNYAVKGCLPIVGFWGNAPRSCYLAR